MPTKDISSALDTHLLISVKRSEIENEPRSPNLRLRTANVFVSISAAPITANIGTRCCSAFRTCFAKRSLPRSTSTRIPICCACFAMSLQYSNTESVTGRSLSCTGASHNGKSPEQFSINIPKNRSIDPKIARWTMIGRSRVLSELTYSKSNLSGKLKSHWTVEHCHCRPIASRIFKSILGP